MENIKEYEKFAVIASQIVIISGILILNGLFILPAITAPQEYGVLIKWNEALQRMSIAFGSVFLLIGSAWLVISLFGIVGERILDFSSTPFHLEPDNDPKLNGGIP